MVAFLPLVAFAMPLKMLLLKSPETSSRCTSVISATDGENAAGGVGAGAGLPLSPPPQAVTTARAARVANAEGIRVWRRERVMGNSSSVAKPSMVMSDGDASVTLDVF